MKSEYKYSVCLIAPAAYVPAINQFGAALGYGPDSLSVPLSADGSEPATHYGGRTDATPSFLIIIDNGLMGELPKELSSQAPEQVKAILEQLITSRQIGGDPFQQMQELLAEHGLQTINPAGE